MIEFNYNKFYSLVYDLCGHGVSIKKKNNAFYVCVQCASDVLTFCEFLAFNAFNFNYKASDSVFIVSMSEVQHILNLFNNGVFEFYIPIK